jgi:hypothetical protein
LKGNQDNIIKKLRIRPEIKLTQVYLKKKSRFPSPSHSTAKKRPKWPNLHKVLSAFQRLLERAKSTSENKNKNLKKIRGVLTTSTYAHTKFENIWLKTVVLRGLQNSVFA